MLVTGSGHAQDVLDTIDVVTELEPLTGDVQHQEHTGTHQHVPRASLERNDVELGDILANEAGIQHRQAGGFGTYSSVSLRGGTAAQTGVFLDGILLNSAGNAAVDLSTLELLSVQSVDIYRGSSPAQLGAGNIGGAVNLLTRGTTASTNNNTASRTQAQLAAGSFGMRQMKLAHSSIHRGWDVAATTSLLNSANSFTYLDNNDTDLNPLDDKHVQRNNAQVEKLGLMSRTGYQWNDNSRTDLLVQATRNDRGVPSWENTPDISTSYDTQATQLQLTHREQSLGDWNTALSGFVHDNRAHFDDSEADLSLLAQNSHSDTRTIGVHNYWEHIGDTGTLTFSAELREENLQSRDAINAAQNYKVNRGSFSANTQYAWFSEDEKWLLTPGLQFQQINDRYDGISRRNNNRNDDQSLGARIGVAFKPSTRWHWRANLGQYYRQPAFYELFGSRGLVIGSNNLLPEKGINTDIGFTWTPNPAMAFSATAFASFRDELIVTEFDSLGIGHVLNAGEARVLGVEIDSEIQFNRQWSAKANLTLQDASNIAAADFLDDKQLPGEAQVAAYARLQYNNGRQRYWYEADIKGERFYDLANRLKADDHWLHNIGIDRHWRDFKASVGVNNLGNENVQDFNGFPRPGRAFFLSFSYSFN